MLVLVRTLMLGSGRGRGRTWESTADQAKPWNPPVKENILAWRWQTSRMRCCAILACRGTPRIMTTAK
jgi:hypothetical protein